MIYGDILGSYGTEKERAEEWCPHSKAKIWPILHDNLVTLRDTMYVNVIHLYEMAGFW